jgi:hypothetical protein
MAKRRSLSRTAIAAVFIAGATAHAGDIHRCMDGDRVLYTDRPCGAGARTVVLADLTPVATAPASDAVEPVPVTLGMSLRSVHEALGRPYETIARLEGRTLVEDWIYRAPDATMRIVFRQGRVTGVTMR